MNYMYGFLHEVQSFSFSNISNVNGGNINNCFYLHILPNRNLSIICNYFHNLTGSEILYIAIGKDPTTISDFNFLENKNVDKSGITYLLSISNISFVCKNSIFYSNYYDVILDPYTTFADGLFENCYFCKNKFIKIRPNLGCAKSIEMVMTETWGFFLMDGESENQNNFPINTRYFAKPMKIIKHTHF
jgi:hypothetical protein